MALSPCLPSCVFIDSLSRKRINEQESRLWETHVFFDVRRYLNQRLDFWPISYHGLWCQLSVVKALFLAGKALLPERNAYLSSLLSRSHTHFRFTVPPPFEATYSSWIRDHGIHDRPRQIWGRHRGVFLLGWVKSDETLGTDVVVRSLY